jgi:hypothetical protein
MADSTPAAEALTAATTSPALLQLAATVEALAVQWFQPLNVVLVVGIVMFARFMHKANQRADFSLVDALRGPDGKASMKLVGYVVALILGSWALMNCATSWQTQPNQFVEVFGIYLIALVAPKILAEYIQAKYRGTGKEEDRRKDDDHRP